MLTQLALYRRFVLSFFVMPERIKSQRPVPWGPKAGRRRGRPRCAGCFAAGHEGSPEENAQGRSEPIQALPAAHGPVMEAPLGRTEFRRQRRFRGFVAPQGIDRSNRRQMARASAIACLCRKHRRPRSSLSSFTAACWWRAIVGRRRATPSFTIARTKCSKSIGIRSWRSPACPRRRGKWRACSSIRFNFSAAPNSRK